MDGDDKRYGKLKAPIGEGLFAAYDPLDMKAAKYLIVSPSPTVGPALSRPGANKKKKKKKKVSDCGQFRLSLYAPFSLFARRNFLDGA